MQPSARLEMRVLALDYGSARCGCAICDPTGTIVTPLDPVRQPSTRRGLDALAQIVGERDVEQVVVGLPLSLRGEDTEQTLQAREFTAALAARLGAQVPVDMYDERFTTRIAARMHGSNSSEDSRAAAILLEEWLTTHSR
jgi:putative holliday junction resolvase